MKHKVIKDSKLIGTAWEKKSRLVIIKETTASIHVANDTDLSDVWVMDKPVLYANYKEALDNLSDDELESKILQTIEKWYKPDEIYFHENDIFASFINRFDTMKIIEFELKNNEYTFTSNIRISIDIAELLIEYTKRLNKKLEGE